MPTTYPSSYRTSQHRGPEIPRSRRSTSERVYQGPGKGAGKLDPVGGYLGLYGKKRGGKRDYLTNDLTGGYESVLQSFEGGESSADAVQNLLANFKGSPQELADFMEIAGPLMGGLESRRLEGSEGLGYMSDQANWDMGAMGGYGAAAGQIGRNTQQAIRTNQQGLAAQGLGRGSGRSAAASMLQQQGSNQQADLRSQLEQTASRNRMGSANSLFDAHRTIAQLALGQQITPRITSPQGSDTGMGGVAGGAAAGASLGSMAGPWGTLIGGVAGAGYGAYEQNRGRGR